MRTWIKRLAQLGALGALWAGSLAGPADGAGLSPVVVDCNAHGQLTQSYTVAQLQRALATIPVDINEYTNCHDAIEHQLLRQLGKLSGAGPGSGGGSFLPTWLLLVSLALVLGGVASGVVALRRPERAP